jgi:hypothetical protein
MLRPAAPTSKQLHFFYFRTLTNSSQLGTFGRAKRKVEEMTNIIAESRRAGH